MPNTPEVTQGATLLNSVVRQATGQSAIGNLTNLATFVSTATTLLTIGKDPVLNALTQVMEPTIFAERPYDQPLASLAIPGERWGNIIRKLAPVADEMEDDNAWLWPVAYDASQNPADGYHESVDPYAIHKQDALETHFMGSVSYMQHFTTFENQFDVAFHGPAELTQFFQMLVTERRNDRESFEEAKARLLQLNFIGAILDENNSNRVVHLLTEYNGISGQSLSATDIMQQGNFEAFVRWMYAKIRTIVGQMRARSNKFQTNITGKTILRHTDANNLRVAIYRPFMEYISSMVLSNLYNADMMRLPTYEAIDYWQSINTPGTINVTPVYTDTSGSPKTGNAVNNATVIGLIHDRDALGYAMRDFRMPAPIYNPRGLYWNTYVHARFTACQDNTEKAVVLCLD